MLTKIQLFEKLSNLNKKTGWSRWVSRDEFKNEYEILYTRNGLDWGRKSCKYIIGKKRKSFGKSPNTVIAYRAEGFSKTLNQNIKSEFKRIISKQKCSLLGISGLIEVDHKNGRKNNERVGNIRTQKLSDFQPLHKTANDAKRQACKDCVATGERFDAKELGYKKSFLEGGKFHNGTKNGCIGCYWYDIKEFRKNL